MGTARKSIIIDANADELYEYMGNPKTWVQWYANFSEPDKITGDGESGNIVEAKYSLMGEQTPFEARYLINSRDCSVAFLGHIS